MKDSLKKAATCFVAVAGWTIVNPMLGALLAAVMISAEADRLRKWWRSKADQ